MSGARPRLRVKEAGAAARTGVPVMNAGGAAWFLDFDGTLVEIVRTPDQVRVGADVLDMLRELERASQGAVALISGRRIEDIDRLFAPLHLSVAGQHGAERRGASGRVHQFAPTGLDGMRGSMREWVAKRPGLLLEDKGSTLAVHYRQAPELAEPLGAFMQKVVAETAGRYCLQVGKMVFEIRPSDLDKGSAVLEFMREAPFIGRVPVFIGDDITDESAFAAVLGLGGTAVKVGKGESIAPWRLQGVADVHAWLHASVAAESARRAAQ